MDRISCLPNYILCEILSYLPTKQAGSTSLLSRRWRHVWKDLQVIDIDDRHFRDEDPFDSYVNAIILTQRNADYSIEKFRLACETNSTDLILTWLDAVIGPHLRELYLNLHVNVRFGLKLPEAIFTCPLLKSLVLKRKISLNYGPEFPNVYLPSLKNLKLKLFIPYVHPNKLLSGCPVLENLTLILANDTPDARNVYVPTIQMPRTLKSLTFEDDTIVLDEIYHRVIDTPSLEYLNIKITIPKNSELLVSFSSFPNTVEAHLDIDHARVEHGAWCLFSAPAFKFPEFHRLVNLEVDVPCFNTNFMLNFLHNCHVLEGLVVGIWTGFDSYTMEYHGPTPPTMVPNCVTSYLKSVEFRVYQDTADEREFIVYLLQKGLVLKTVTISLDPDFDQETKYEFVRELYAELYAIPRGSTTCQLNIWP
ncbi:F-box/FBD/LRR-repeat protein At1g16930-like [Arachis stenosperma]|uniref:F-box/FBD/LRR-repeat protein At1g16930-like n=1 Tax=Arachis stenosperma TaxID=217475 RepID=UPI0025AC6E44|nr:F-box/FBD/LRR-repeat protein At1g16930-like [Arachis stenosperma]